MVGPPLKIERDVPLDYRLNIDGWEYAVEKMPDSKCRKNCYGRGWVGKQSITEQPILCSCIGHWNLLHEPGGGGAGDGPPE